MKQVQRQPHVHSIVKWPILFYNLFGNAETPFVSKDTHGPEYTIRLFFCRQLIVVSYVIT